jgi:hypothetical protein
VREYMAATVKYKLLRSNYVAILWPAEEARKNHSRAAKASRALTTVQPSRSCLASFVAASVVYCVELLYGFACLLSSR